MRVLHINCNYLGTTLHRLMIEELTKMGIDNKVFVPINKNFIYKEENENLIVSRCFNKWDRLFYYYKQKKILSAVEQIDISRFDLIHAYTLFTDGNIASVLSEKFSIPYVVAVRNTDVNYFLKYMFFLRNRGRKILSKASGVFFLSPSYKNQVFSQYVEKNLYQNLNHKTYILPNGIDQFWHNNIKIHNKVLQSKLHLLYVGVIDNNKNIDLTVRAIKILLKQGIDVQFSIVGRVLDEKLFKRLTRFDFISYYPHCTKEELLSIYDKHDIFIMPSHRETFGLVYAEAMTRGLPVIYTKGQGFDGQFDEGEVGYSVNDKDPLSIVDSVYKIMSNYEKISKNCIRLSNKFQWQKICLEYASIYNNIIYGGKR